MLPVSLDCSFLIALSVFSKFIYIGYNRHRTNKLREYGKGNQK
jgi:hypothetical protein